jgi:hypothetical protein
MFRFEFVPQSDVALQFLSWMTALKRSQNRQRQYAAEKARTDLLKDIANFGQAGRVFPGVQHQVSESAR